MTNWILVALVLGACGGSTNSEQTEPLSGSTCSAIGEATCAVIHSCRGYVDVSLCVSEWTARCAAGIDSALSSSEADACISDAERLTCPEIWEHSLTYNNWPTCSEIDALSYHEYDYGTVGWSCEAVADARWERGKRCSEQQVSRSTFRSLYVASCCGSRCASPSAVIGSDFAQAAQVTQCRLSMAASSCADDAPDSDDSCLSAR